MHSSIRIVGSYETIMFHCQMILEYLGCFTINGRTFLAIDSL